MKSLITFVKGWQTIFLITILIGITLRWFNLDQKVYWHDEVYSSWRIMGYNQVEIFGSTFTGEVIDQKTLQFSQQVNPDKTLKNTLESLAKDDPQHPPLYYIIARFWVRLLGNSITSIRALSVLISLFIFPAAYWLCLELFTKPLAGRIMVALLAISPFHLLFAQEAREYVLGTLTTLLCCGALLRAIRMTHEPQSSGRKIYLNWGIYAGLLCLGLYTFLFTGLVILGHVIYSFIIEKFRFSQVIKCQLVAIIVAILGFVPWIVVLVNNYQQFHYTTNWTQATHLPLKNLINIWSLMLSQSWVDLPLNSNHPIIHIIKITSVILFGIALGLLYHQRTLKSSVFILTLAGVNFLFLAIPDMMFGGIRSLSLRYLIPTILGLELALTNLLTFQFTNPGFNHQKLGRILFSFMMIMGVISCIFISYSDAAWTKVVSYNLPKIAPLINDAKNPLVVTNNLEVNTGNIVSLSYLLNPEVKYQLFLEYNIPQLDTQFDTIFFFSLKDDLQKQIEKQNNLQSELVFKDEFITLRKAIISNSD